MSPDRSDGSARRLDVTPIKALDGLWIGAAARLGIPVSRGGEAYVHWDGRTLHLADEAHLDDDDTVAQLVFHEICHLLTQGLHRFREPDWGMDNTHDGDAVNEEACLRLQAHLASAHGLRGALYPTTVVAPFYFALPPDAFASLPGVTDGATGPGEASRPLARQAALRAAQPPFAAALDEALAATARHLGLRRHRAGFALHADEALTCATCSFFRPGRTSTRAGACQKAPPRTRVLADERACARHEQLPDCRLCGACCRSAYDTVLIGPRALVRRARPDLVEERDGTLRLRRDGDHCAALSGPPGGPWSCTAYEVRPATCRDFTRGSRNCATARRKVGLGLG